MTPQEVRDRYHGHPYEVVIPCLTLDEANAEKADLHAEVEARAVVRLAGTGGVLDRDHAREVLNRYLRLSGRLTEDEALDALAAAVRPAAIDRDALERVLLDYFEAKIAMPLIRDRILALVRPVAGEAAS